MKARHLVTVGLCVPTFAVVVALRWPRLDSELVAVTRSEVRGDEMVVEYRMPQRFEVGVVHGLRTPTVWSSGPNLQIGSSTPLRKEPRQIFPSDYDWVRGEHYIRMTFRRGTALVIDVNGRRLEFPVWSLPDASGARWHATGDGTRFGDGNGHDLVTLAESAEQHEYLRAYVGTDTERSDR